LARGLNAIMRPPSSECDLTLLAVEGVGVFPLAILGQDAKPLMRRILGCQFSVVFEDDRR
jgi:hypothetical protein